MQQMSSENTEETIAFARDWATRRIANGATTDQIPQMFSDDVTEDIYAAHPDLALLRVQLSVSTQADIDAHMTDREWDAMELLDGPDSERTIQLRAKLAAGWARILGIPA